MFLNICFHAPQTNAAFGPENKMFSSSGQIREMQKLSALRHLLCCHGNETQQRRCEPISHMVALPDQFEERSGPAQKQTPKVAHQNPEEQLCLKKNGTNEEEYI